MSGIGNLTDYWNPNGRSPMMARMTACVDSGEICNFNHNCFNVKLRGQVNSQIAAIKRMVNLEGTPVSEKTPVLEERLVRTLLSAVLIPSHVAISRETIKTDASFCRYDLCFSRDVWTREVQTRFEIALAGIQMNLVDIVHGRAEQFAEYGKLFHVEIPPEYRGLCTLGKFQTVGWRNVSAWGLLGLFAFALAITLASIQTEEEEFWITVATRKIV